MSTCIMQRGWLTYLVAIVVILAAIGPASAAVVLKADNPDDLNLATSWVGGVAPTSADIATWDGTVTAAANAEANLGGNVDWLGISILNPASAVIINNPSSSTLTLRGSGIDMTAAMQNLTINANLDVASYSQSWLVKSGQTLTVNGSLAGTLTGADKLTIGGGGTTVLNGFNSFTGNIEVSSPTGVGNSTLRLANSSAITSGTITLLQAGVAGGTGTVLNLGDPTTGSGVNIGSGVNLVMNSDPTMRSALTSGVGMSSWAGNVTLNGSGLNQFNAGGTTGTTTLTVSGAISGPTFTGTLFVRGSGDGLINGTLNMPGGILAKTDAGTWTIATTSPVVAAAVRVADGTMKIVGTDLLPTTIKLTVGQTSGTSGNFDLNGNSQAFIGLETDPVSTGTANRVTTSGGFSTLTLNVPATDTYTFNGAIGATGLDGIALIKNGLGTQVLGRAGVYTGGTTVNSGILRLTHAGAVGIGDVNVTATGYLESNLTASGDLTANIDLHGTPLRHLSGNQLGVATGKRIKLWTNNDIDVSVLGPTGKILLDSGELESEAGVVLTKKGLGVLQLSAAGTGNPNFLGTVVVDAGFVEFQNVDSLGIGTNTQVVNNGGEFLSSGVPVRHHFTINAGGALSANLTGGADYQGTITLPATGKANVLLRKFQNTAEPSSMVISGPLVAAGGAGTGNLNVTGVATTNAWASSLALTANNTTYSGDITAGRLGRVTTTVDSLGSTTNGFGNATLVLDNGTIAIAPQITTAGVNPGLVGNWYNQSTTTIGNGVIGGFDFGLYNPNATQQYPAGVNLPDIDGTPTDRPAGINAVNIGVLWTGILNVGSGGVYNFNPTADDGTVLYIDGQIVMVDDVSGGPRNLTRSVALQPGYHTIVLKYGQGTGGASMTFNYSGPDTGNTNVVLGSGGSVSNDGTILLSTLTSKLSNAITTTSGSYSTIDLVGTNVEIPGTINMGANSQIAVTGATGSEKLTLSGTISINDRGGFYVGTMFPATNGAAGAPAGADLEITGTINEAVPGSAFIATGEAPTVTTVRNRALILNGTNNFTGLATVQRGILNVKTPLQGGVMATSDLGSNSGRLLWGASDIVPDTAPAWLVGYSGLGGGTLDLANFSDKIGALTIVNNQGTSGVTVQTGTGTLTLNGDVNIYGSSTGTSTISGNLDLGKGPSNAGTRVFNVWGASNNNISATLVAGSGHIVKNGLGQLTLSGANSSYDGQITVNSGRLSVATDPNALGSTSAGTIVNPGGYLDIVNGTAALTLSSEPLTIAGYGQPLATPAVNSFGGPQMSGALQGSGTFTTASPGATLLGPITLAGDAGIGVPAGALLTISGVIDDGAGTFSLTKTQGNATAPISTSATTGGSGILKLTNTNTYGGATTVQAGDLWLASTASPLPGQGAAIQSTNIIIGDGHYDAALTMAASGQQFPETAILTFAGGSKNAKFQLNGTSQIVAGFNASGLAIIQNHETTTTPGPGTLIVKNPAATSFNGYIRDQSGAANNLSLIKRDVGTLTLSGNGIVGTGVINYTGQTTIEEGKLLLSDTTAFNSPITLNFGGAGSLEFNMSYGRTLNYAKVLYDNGIGFTKTGLGNLTFSGTTQSFVTGAVNVNQGTLNLTPVTGNLNPLPGAPIIVAAGARLEFHGVSAQSITFDNNVTLNGMTPGGALSGAVVGGTPTNVLSGTLTLNATSNISTGWSDKRLDITGQITEPSGAGSALVFDKLFFTQLPGVFNITNTMNNYTGGTVINTGTVQFTSGGALPTTGNLKFGGTWGNGGNFGTGQLVLSATAGDTFTRNVGAGAGEVQFTGDGGGFTAIGAKGTVTFGNVGPISWNGTGLGLDATSSLVLNTGTGANNEVEITNAFTLGAGMRRVVVGANAGRLSGALGGAGGLNKDGAGNLFLSGATSNTYSGLTNVSGGTLTLAKSGAIAVPGDLQISNNQGGTRRVVYLNASQQIADTATVGFIGSNANNGDLRLFGFDETVAAIQDRSGGGVIEVVEAETATNTLPGQNAAGSTLTVNGAGDSFYNGFLRNLGSGAYTGTLSLVKDGTGTLTISAGQQSGNGNQSYSGTTTINNGKLVFANIGTYNSPVTVNAAGTVEFLANVNQNLTENQVIAGAGNLIKSGSGTIALSGTNQYAGSTTVSGGALQITGAQTAPHTGAYSVNNGAVLLIGNGTTAGELTNNNAVTVAAGGAVAFSRNNAYAYSGVISGAGNVESRTAGGVITLSGANAYTGATIARAGTLVLGGANISGGGLDARSGGALTLDFAQPGSAVTNLVAAGAPVALAGGALNILGGSGANTQALGAVTLDPGASTISAAVGGGSLGVSLGAITAQPGAGLDISLAGATLTTTTTPVGGLLGGYATFGGASFVALDGGGAMSAATGVADTYGPGVNTDVSLGGAGASANSLRFNNAAPATVTFTGTNAITTGGILVTAAVGANAQVITGGTLTGGAANTGLFITQNDTTVGGGLRIESDIADNGGASALTKLGAGTLTLSGANTYSGETFVTAGTLINAGTLGTGKVHVDAGATLQLGATTIGAVQSTLESMGTLEFRNPAAQTFTTPINVGVNFNHIVGAAAHPETYQTGVITKTGTGLLTVTSTIATSQIHQRSGTTIFQAAANVVSNGYNSIGLATGDNATATMRGATRFTQTNDFNVGDTGGVGRLNLQEGALLTIGDFFVGKTGTAVGIVTQTLGAVANAGSNEDWRIGGSATGNPNAYGIYNLSGGNFQTGRNWQIGAYGVGVFNQTGGAVTTSGGTPVVGRFTGGFGLLNLSNGTFTNTVGTNVIAGENGTGVINVSGGGQLLVNAAAANIGLALGGPSGGDGTVNLLAGGLIQAGQVRDFDNNSTVSPSRFNFNGGTLRVANNSNAATFMTGLTSAIVQPGGANIDTNGIDTTIVQPLIAPSGSGISAINAPDDGGSGYLAEPIVQLVTTSGTGSGATARATLSGGTISGFTITNPGSGYSPTDVIAVNILGGGGSGFVPNSSAPVSFATSTTTGGLNKIGAGTLTLASQATYGGATTITGGTLKADFAAATAPATNLLPATGLVLNGGSLLVTGKASTTNSQTFAGVTINAPATITGTIGTSGTVNLVLGAITRNAGGAVNFVRPATGTITTTTANTGTSILGGWATVNGTDWANSSGSSPYSIIAATASTDNTWAAANNTRVNTSNTAANNGTTNSLRFNVAGARTQTLQGANIIATGGILVTSAVANNASIITGGTSLAAGTNNDLVVHQFNTSNTLAINSPIVAAGTGGLVKTGPGVLVLGPPSANSYNGNTVIGAGTLRLNTANNRAIPNGAGKGDLHIHAGASLDLNGFDETVNGLWGYGSVTNGNTANKTLTVGDNNASSTFSGTILNGSAGANVLTKTGTGVLTLNNLGAHTYTGATNVNGGAIKIATPNALAHNTTINVGASGTLQFDTTIPVVYALVGSGAIDLRTQATSPVANAAVQLSLGNNNATRNAYSGVLSGTGTVVKIGTGTQLLAGNNTLTGGVQALNGTLGLQGDNSGAAGAMVANGGALQFNTPTSFLGGAANKVLVPSGGIVTFAAGTANPAAANFGAITPAFARIDATSLGVLALQSDGSVQAPLTEDLDFAAADSNLSLGAMLAAAENFGNAPVQYTGVITPKDATFRLGGGGGRLILPNAATLAGNNSLITYGGGRSDGQLFLTGAYSYTGSTLLNQGGTLVTNVANGGVASSLGAATSAATNLVLNNGTLGYIGAGASTDRLFTLSSLGGALDNSGPGTLNFTNTGAMGFLNAGNRTLTLQGNNYTANTLAAVVGDSYDVAGAGGTTGNGVTTLVKAGSGTWILSGMNTFSGGVTINGGVLGFTSAAALGANASTGPATVLVNGGGAVGLFGSLTAGVQSTLNRISPLSTGTVALTADSGENLNFDGGAAGATLPTAYLGAYGNVTYTGTLTPFGNTYRLGGGGGVLTMPNGGLTGARGLVIGGGGPGANLVNGPNRNGAVVLGGTSDYSGGTYLAAGGTLSVTNLAALGNGPLRFQGGVYRAIDATDITLASDGTSAREIRIGADASSVTATAHVEVLSGVDLTFSKIFGQAATLGSNYGGANSQTFTKWGGGSLTLQNGINLGRSDGTNTLATNVGTLTIERGTLSMLSNPTNYAGNIQVGSNNGGVATLKLGADNVFADTIAQYGSASVVDLYSGSVLELNGKSDTFRLVRGMGSIVNSGAAGANLTLGTNNETCILGGNLVGDFTLTRNGTVTNLFGTGSTISSTELWNNNNVNFTGKLVATAGGIRVRADGALGSPTEPFKADKITLTNSAVLLNLNNPMAIGANHGITLGSGGGTLWAYGTSPMIVNAPIVGSGPLTIADDSGAVFLASDSNAYTGGTVINSNTAARGNLFIGAGGATGNLPAGDVFFNSGSAMARLYFFKSTDMVVANNIKGPGLVLQVGGGTTTLRGNVTTDRAVYVAGGKLVADFATDPTKQPISSGANLNVSAGTFEYQGPAGDNVLRLGALANNYIGGGNGLNSIMFVGAGTGDAVLQSTYGGSGTQMLEFNGLGGRLGGSTLDFVVSGGTNGLTHSISFAAGSAGTTTLLNNVMGAGYYFGGSDFAALDGGLFVRAPNYGVDFNTAAPDTVVAGRYLKLTTALTGQAAVSVLGINLSGVATDITLNANSALTLSGNPGGLLKSGGGASIIGGAAGATVNNNAQELIVRTDAATDVLRIDVPIAGTGALTKSGLGQLTLTAANTFTGNTLIAQGAILVTGSGALGTTGSGEIRMANAAGQTATLNIDSATASISTGTGANCFRVGEAGAGIVNQSAGTVTAGNYMVLGESLGASGTYNISGGVLNVKTNTGAAPAGQPNLNVGRAGTGTMTISGTAAVNLLNGAQLQLGGGTYSPVQTQSVAANTGMPTGVGTVTQTGGDVTVAVNNGVYQSNLVGAVVLGVQGTGTYNLDGGTLTTPILARGHGTANFNLGGGTLKAPTPVPTLPMSIFNVDLPLTLTGTGAGKGAIDTNGNDAFVTGALGGAGGFVKAGSGTLAVLGGGAYAGGTDINVGGVVSAGTSLGTGRVTIANGASLAIQGVQEGLLAKFYLTNKTSINPSVTTGSADMSPEFASLDNFNAFTSGKALVAVEPTTARGKVAVNYGDMGGGNQNTALPPAIIAISAGDEPFVAHLSGRFNAPVAGEYTFQSRSDDGSMVWVDGETVLDNNRSQGQVARTGTINLSAGPHDIVVGYYQGTGGGGFSVGVTLPNQGQSFLIGNELNMPNALLSHGSNELSIGSLAGVAGASVQLGDGTLKAGSDNTTSTFAGAIAGTGNLVKEGAGKLTLSGADGNNYQGNTYVKAGILEVISGVNSNDTALGDTTVALSDGSSPSVVELITEHVRQDTLTINANGKVSITGTTTSVVNFLQIANGSGGFTWDAGSGGSVPAGTTGGGDNNVSPVPEPATWLLAAIAAAVGVFRWRRRRH